ncbi:MAG: tetratricopeptide repeat protein [Proteobacteria bacterium]|nr:tetratricopeptide repeat protein [Pseudomonadota bacterium]
MDERIKQLLALGREHYEKREYDKAYHYLGQFLEHTDTYADVFNMVGVIHHDQGRLEEARAAFLRALRLNEHYTEAALNLAVTYNDLGKYAEAQRVYADALDRGPDRKGDIDRFAKGKIANLHAELAQAYVDVGMSSEAVQELRKAIHLCPRFADLRLKLANVYRQANDLGAARSELEEALRIKPDYASARIALGVVLLVLGKRNEAVKQWARAAEQQPGDQSARMYLRMATNPPAEGVSSPPSEPPSAGS